MLQVTGLRKRLGQRQVLEDVSFVVQAGEVFGLLGANGSGKTTTINIVSGLLTPDAGTVAIAGNTSMAQRCHRLGFAPQETALYPTLTCEENLEFFARLYRLRPAERRNGIATIIDQLGLGPYRDSRVGTLSGGWKRRLNLAVALVHEPAVLLLDEPTAGLDIEARHLVWERVRQEVARESAVLLTTHLLEEAESLCDRLGILVNGRLVAQGSQAELRALVPAVELASIECENRPLLQRMVRDLGLDTRTYDGRTSILLRERTSVAHLAAQLGDVGLRSLTLERVSLHHVFMEVRAANAESFGEDDSNGR